MKLTFNDNQMAVFRGAICSLLIEARNIEHHSQVQVNIIEAGKLNPKCILSTSTAPTVIGVDMCKVDINTENMPRGLYEVGLIRFHTPVDEVEPSFVDLIKERDFSRLIFSVNSVFDIDLFNEVPSNLCEQMETSIEARFNAGIHLTESPGGENFTCFAFVKNLLIGQRTRFDRFEIFPHARGLDSKDSFDLINEFFQTMTETGLKFSYSVDAMTKARSENPVAIVHFPKIVAKNADLVQKYCQEQVNVMINALALSRDSKGEAFDFVVINLNRPDAGIYSLVRPYRGNALTGQLAGENPEVLQNYVSNLSKNSFNNFLLTLYREAVGDSTPDFQILRLWQILELIGKNRNYDQSQDLTDENGKVILSLDGKPQKIKSDASIVYLTMRDFQIDIRNAWTNANVWFGFRTAIIHHGAVENYQSLQRPEVRHWVEVGLERNKSAGHNTILSELRSCVNLLLRTLLQKN